MTGARIAPATERPHADGPRLTAKLAERVDSAV